MPDIPKSGRSVNSSNHKNEAEKILIQVPSEARFIREVSTKITDSIAPHRPDEHKLFEIKLCVEEAMRNAMVHGNRSDASKSVKVSYSVENNNVVIEVEDEGAGFNHRKLPDPTQKENLMRTSGRGVYLIKKIMDRVEFNESGNKIKMTKKFK